MRFLLLPIILLAATVGFAQTEIVVVDNSKNIFKFIELKTHFGAFLKSDGTLSQNGLLDNGYSGVTLKLGWQPTNPEDWQSRYSYPSYGVGFYSGFLSDAKVFGNPNAVYGFIRFPFSDPNRRTSFSIEPSLGLTYNLKPYNSDQNPLNDAIGARMAVYFNLNFGFTYKWTRELDLLYGLDFSHFSNGATYKPNSGLNLYGFNMGLRYNYNRTQLLENNDPYNNDVLPARFRRPLKTPMDTTKGNSMAVYVAGGIAQSDELLGRDIVLGTFTALAEYEHQFNERHSIAAGLEVFYDNRLQDLTAENRWSPALHAGYAFSFERFDIKMQFGTYIGDDKGKGAFFMRPALRYHLTKTVFAQVGLKTLDGGAADYIEYGLGFKPFAW